MRNPLSAYLPWMAAGLLIACFNGGSGSPASLGELVQVVPYTATANAIQMPAYLDTIPYCTGETREISIIPHEAQMLSFEVSGNLLRLYTHTDPNQPGAIVLLYTRYERYGYGSGLEGDWIDTGREYRVVSGVLGEEEKRELDGLVESYRKSLILRKSALRFTGGTVSVFVNEDLAAEFIQQWNGRGLADPQFTDSARYAIAVTRLFSNTIEFEGRKTGETVRLVQSATGDAWYSSDVEGHDDLIHRAKPLNCPNPEHPPWFTDFKEANRND